MKSSNKWWWVIIDENKDYVTKSKLIRSIKTLARYWQVFKQTKNILTDTQTGRLTNGHKQTER